MQLRMPGDREVVFVDVTMCAAWVASGEHAVQSSLFVGHFCGSCTTHGARGAATCGP